jgi:hypothetical protein
MKQRKNRLKKNTLHNRFLIFLKKNIIKTPYIGFFSKYFGKKILYFFFKVRIKYQSKKLGLVLDEIHLVDPNKIVFCTPLEFHPFKHMGKIAGGDWDKTNIRFDELDIFQAMKKRYFENEEWRNTDFYTNALQIINNGEVFKSCNSEENLMSQLEKTDQLFQDIKQNGYKSQLDLNKGKPKYCLEDIDEISINISRNGEFLFNNSAHRLVIAKLLNIKKVPIIITVRHLDLREKS